MLVVAAATLGTAAVVSVSGLIGFVGIIVPHTIRLVVRAELSPDPAALGALRGGLFDLSPISWHEPSCHLRRCRSGSSPPVSGHRSFSSCCETRGSL